MRTLCLISLIVVGSTYSTFGQVRNEFFRSLFVDVEGNGGLMTENIKAIPISTNYTDALNAKQSTIKFNNGSSVGGNVTLGYYFNAKRTWGIGLGVNYMKQQGNLSMDTFHVEYRSTDYLGGTFRQSISSVGDVKESITTTNINIPLLLRYKKSFSENFFLTIDAGVVYNVQSKNTSSSDARFDYEAIYKYDEGNTPVYDNSPVPSSTDFLITKAFYNSKYPNGDVTNYFAFQDSIGKSVGLNQKAIENAKNIKYKTGSFGYTIQAAVNFKLVKNVYLRVGGYYTALSLNNTSTNNALRLTDQLVKDKAGNIIGVNYNSMLNEVQTANTSTYGVTVGLRVYINKGAWKYPENDMNKITPATGHGQ